MNFGWPLIAIYDSVLALWCILHREINDTTRQQSASVMPTGGTRHLYP